MKPQVCVLKTDGTNCDQETMFAFDLAGGQSFLVHINQLKSGEMNLRNYQILVLSGGFSYGDDVASGKILAVELLSRLRDQLERFVGDGKPIIGICNGFQVLVRTGLLPFADLGVMTVTLTHNDSGSFQCEPVDMVVQPSRCIWTKAEEGQMITLQQANGEGNFFAAPGVMDTLEANGLIALRYLHNPNGSMHDVAGICDPTGLIFGLMPHPERYVTKYQHGNWRRISHIKPHGLPIFENGVAYAAQL